MAPHRPSLAFAPCLPASLRRGHVLFCGSALSRALASDLSAPGLKKPGPDLRKALDALKERQIEGSITDRPAAEVSLKDWAKKNLK